MKKVICNVLYKATLPILHKEIGKINYNLGLFDDKKLAQTACVIEQDVFSNTGNIYYVGSPNIEEVFVPEDRMQQSQVQYNLVTSINGFTQKDSFIARYKSEKGSESLNSIVDNAIARVGQTEENEEVSSK